MECLNGFMLFQKPSITLACIAILRIEPMMVNMSLIMIKMYQPLTNSKRSDQGTFTPLRALQKTVYSCLTQGQNYMYYISTFGSSKKLTICKKSWGKELE